MTQVGLVQALIRHVKGIGILHHELAATQDARTRTLLVAVLGLNLVQGDREVLVRGVHVLDGRGEHFLVRRAQQHVCALAVLETEEVIPVLGPAVRELVGLARQQRREEHFLAADGIHLLAHNILNLAQRAQT